MQYDNYEKRIKRITKVLKLLFRHKIKIVLAILTLMTATALTAAGISGLIAAKGTIISSSRSYTDEIIYGEELEYKASAFLSRVSYEYCEQGEEDQKDSWTSEFPKDPGDYYVRAVGNAAVGKRYGSPSPFTIKPKDISVVISKTTVIYGESPELTAELVGDDAIAFSEFDYNEDHSYATPRADTVMICDSEGNDVTGRYSISTEGSRIMTALRPIKITVLDASRQYDGTPFTSEAVEVSDYGLAEGDRHVLTFGASVTTVGSVENSVECKIVNSAGEDVTDYYSINTQSGMLSVTPRVIVVATASTTDEDPMIYDGTTKSRKSYTILKGYALAGGETITDTDWASITNAGSVRNTVELAVKNAAGEDTTSNYQIDLQAGTLTMYPRPITVKTNDLQTQYYDGFAHHDHGYDVSGEYGGIVSGHEVEVVTAEGEYSLPTVTRAGKDNAVQNKFALLIKDSEGFGVTSNYKITYEYGTLELQKRPITVTAETVSDLVYNGEGQSHKSVTVAPGEGVKDALIKGHSYEISTFTTTEKDAGSYINKITVIIKDRNGTGSEVTDNYDIKYVDGTITINPLSVRVTTRGVNSYYNATYQSNIGYICHDLQKIGHTIAVKKSTSVLISDYDESTGNYKATDNVFEEYTVLDKNGEAVDKKNVIITEWSYGKLIVKKRPIIIEIGSISKVYNGKDITCNKFSVLTNDDSLGLVQTDESYHEIEGLEIKGSLRNVGWTVNSYDSTGLTIKDVNGNGTVTKYYDIKIEDGTIEVKKRPIRLTSESYEEYYNGKYNQAWSFEVIEEANADDNRGLVDGQKVEVTYGPEFKNIDDAYENNLSFVIKGWIDDETYGDVTQNYEYKSEYTYGTINVKKRPITVKSGDYADVYDGKSHSNTTLTVINVDESKHMFDICVIDNIPHKIVPTDYNTFKNVWDSGEGKNDVKFIIIDTQNGNEDVTRNYDFTDNGDVIYGDVDITPRPITVTTPDYVGHTYDGVSHQKKEIYDSTEDKTRGGLCDGHDFYIYDWSLLKNVSEKENNVYFYIIDENGEFTIDGHSIKNENYKVTFVAGEVDIKPLKVVIGTRGHTFTYNGTEQYWKEYYTVDGTKFLDMHKVDAKDWTKIVNVWDAPVTDPALNRIVLIVRDEDGHIVTDNYDIQLPDENCGALIMKPRQITVISLSDEKYYDGSPFKLPDFDLDIYMTGGIHEDELVDGHNISATFTGKNDWIGRVFNTYKDVVITDAEGNDVTKNYAITEEDGTLRVIGLISVIPTEQSKIYDGLPLTPVIEEYEGAVSSKSEFDLYDVLIEKGYKVEIEAMTGSITLPGTENSYVTVLRIYDPKGTLVLEYTYVDEDNVTVISEDFEVERQAGRLTVYAPEQQNLDIYIFSVSQEYDGKAHEIPQNNFWILNDSDSDSKLYNWISQYVNIDTDITFDVKIWLRNLTLTNVGTISAKQINDNVSVYVEYEIIGSDGVDYTLFFVPNVMNMSAGEGEGTDYEVLTVTKRRITIESGSATQAHKEGIELINSEYYITSGSLAEGEYINPEFKPNGVLKEQGTAYNTIPVDKFIIYRDVDGKRVDVSSNYYLKNENGDQVFFTAGKLTLT